MRHGGHTLNWRARDNVGETPLQNAKDRVEKNPFNKESRLLLDLYSTRQPPEVAQHINSPQIVKVLRDDQELQHPPTSLIQAGLRGDIKAIGDLIRAGATVNEVDEQGRTLLHLAAMGGHISNGYQVALELVRHGGHGVHWNAVTPEGKTALVLVEERLQVSESMGQAARKEAEHILSLLKSRKLPPGEVYVFPCMDPNYCRDCSSNPCGYVSGDRLAMPGDFIPY